MDIGIIITGLISGGLFAIVALGLSLVFGVMNIVNIAHGEFITGGAYLAVVVSQVLGADPLLSILVAVPVVFALAYLLQTFVLNALIPRGLEPPLVATFGVSLLVTGVLIQTFGGNPRSLTAPYSYWGFSVLGVSVRFVDVLALAIAVVLVVACHLVVSRTRWGAALRAATGDPVTAGTMGIDVKKVYALTLGFAASFAAVAGGLVSVGYSITPTTGTNYLLIAFAVVVLGGQGSVLGTLVGGLVLGLVQSVGSNLLGGQYRDFVVYAAFLLILILKPTVPWLRDRLPSRRSATGSAPEGVAA